MTDEEHDKVVEMCARLAENLHGLMEGDIPQHVFAGNRIARAIRELRRKPRKHHT